MPFLADPGESSGDWSPGPGNSQLKLMHQYQTKKHKQTKTIIPPPKINEILKRMQTI